MLWCIVQTNQNNNFIQFLTFKNLPMYHNTVLPPGHLQKDTRQLCMKAESSSNPVNQANEQKHRHFARSKNPLQFQIRFLGKS